MSWKKKEKNYIDIEDSILDLESSDFIVDVMNDYQFRIKMPDINDTFYDWYHTSGTVCVVRPDRVCANVGKKAFNSSELISLIIKIETEKNFI